jgi:hypothetical protein
LTPGMVRPGARVTATERMSRFPPSSTVTQTHTTMQHEFQRLITSIGTRIAKPETPRQPELLWRVSVKSRATPTKKSKGAIGAAPCAKIHGMVKRGVAELLKPIWRCSSMATVAGPDIKSAHALPAQAPLTGKPEPPPQARACCASLFIQVCMVCCVD